MRPITILLVFYSLLNSCSQESRLSKQVAVPNFDSLTRVLEAVYESDQSSREPLEGMSKQYGQNSEEMKAQWKVIHKADSSNLLAVRTILQQYGWLSEKEVSVLASEALWLVIQHSDLATQQNFLPLIKLAVKEGKAKGKHYAYLLDRILMRQGKFQMYGSQF